MPGSPLQRRQILYSGTVQGVGFRYTVRSLARRFAVAGFVKNLRDGRVELVVEGDAAEIERFLEAVRRQMGTYIRGVEERVSEPTGRFDGFEIRF
jgi:acylphosphatase